MNRTKIVIATVMALVVVTVVGGLVWWQSDDDARQAGSCDGASYTLETDREDDTTEVSFEVQANEPGQTWDVRIEHAGEALVEGTRTTDEDAEIDVDAYLPQDATGEITATATQGGETGAVLHGVLLGCRSGRAQAASVAVQVWSPWVAVALISPVASWGR